MGEQGVRTYLLLVDPESLTVLWANERVEETVADGPLGSAIGQLLVAVIPFCEALGVPDRVREVARTGESCDLHASGFSVEGTNSYTVASIYRLPSGDVLIASEYTVGAAAHIPAG